MKQRFHEWKQPVFDRDGWTRFGWRCQYPEGLRLGDQVDIGCFSYLNAREGIIIGDDVQIGSHCSIYSVDTERGVSGEVVIGEGSLIGSYSLILPGARIKSFCKVKARSIIKGEQENIKQIEEERKMNLVKLHEIWFPPKKKVWIRLGINSKVE